MGELGPGTCAGYGVGHVGTSWDVQRYDGRLVTWDLCCVQCGTCWDILRYNGGLGTLDLCVLGTVWDMLGHPGMS